MVELSLLLILLVIVAIIILSFVPVGLWISAIAAGVRVSIVTLIGMRLRRVPPSQIILPLIKAEKAGLETGIDKLEAHYLAGGNVDRVVDALVAAHRAQIHLTFERAAAIDLAGRDVLEAVQMSVNPKVIETPDRFRGRAQRRHRAQGEGAGDGAGEHRPAGRRRRRTDDHRPGRRRDRHHRRLVRVP